MIEQHIMRSRLLQGFTLIELLVVISIVALLIAILLPTLKQARESGKQVVCASQMRQYMLGMIQYTLDEDDWIPAYARGDGSNGALDFKNTIAPYVNGAVHSSGDTAAETLAKRIINETLPVRVCPTKLARIGAHYGQISGGVVAPFVWANFNPVTGAPPGLRMSDIKAPGKWIFFLDATAPVGGWDGSTVYSPNLTPFNGDYSGNGINDTSLSLPTAYNGAAMVHFNGLNIALGDGHVQYMQLEEFEDMNNGLWTDD